jgi:phasin family protein
MPSNIQEQIASAANSQLETRLTALTALNNRVLDAVRRLVDLNVQMTKASLAQSAATTRRLMSAHDPQEYFLLIGEQLWPSIDKALNYSRQVAEIGAGMRAEIGKAAQEQVSEVKREAEKLAEGARRMVPAAGNIFGFMQSATDDAGAGYAQISKTSQGKIDTAQGAVPPAAQRTASEMKNERGRSKKK